MAEEPQKDAVKKMLQKDFSEKVANEILDMIDKWVKKGVDVSQIEEEVSQYVLHHAEQDLNAALRMLNGPIIVRLPSN
jgi:type III secretory pathway lipoprotein EscJ